MKAVVLFILLMAFSPFALATIPDCAHADNWAPMSAYGRLKNAGLVRNETTDFAKTKVIRLATEKIGKDLYREILEVTFTELSGKRITVITVSDTSHEECSMSGVEVFVVSNRFGGLKQ